MSKDKYIIIRRRRMPSGDCELSKLDYAPSAMNADVMCMSALKNTEYDISTGDLLFVMDINHVSDFINRSRIMYVIDHDKVVRPEQPRPHVDLSWLQLWEVADKDGFSLLASCCTAPGKNYIDKRRVTQSCVACIKTLPKIYAKNEYLKRIVEDLEEYAYGGLTSESIVKIHNKLPTITDSGFLLAIRQLCDYVLYGTEFAPSDCVNRLANYHVLLGYKGDAFKYMAEVIREAVPLERLFMAVSPRE